MMKNRIKTSIGPLLWVLASALSCQDMEAERTALSGKPIVFRVEVPAGTAEAVPCDDLEGESGTVWFGPPHEFDLQHVEANLGARGGPVIAFEIVESQSEAFSDFTESIVNQRMAIEVDGRILSAPNVNGRLPGRGIIAGGQGGFTEHEVQTMLRAFTGTME